MATFRKSQLLAIEEIERRGLTMSWAVHEFASGPSLLIMPLYAFEFAVINLPRAHAIMLIKIVFRDLQDNPASETAAQIIYDAIMAANPEDES